MKERPILFSGSMVRALLAGTKTQTRRVINPQPRPFIQHTPDRHPTARTAPYIDAYCGERKTPENPRGMGRDWHWWTADNRPDPSPVARCPYGQPGDRLWVRETWCRLFTQESIGDPYDEVKGETKTYFRADGGLHDMEITDGDGFTECRKDGTPVSPWKPSIHMPRKYSRITLEITGVRVELLDQITDADALAEGVDVPPDGWGRITPVMAYMQLWDRINGPGATYANPWVWVIEFRRLANTRIDGSKLPQQVIDGARLSKESTP